MNVEESADENFHVDCILVQTCVIHMGVVSVGTSVSFVYSMNFHILSAYSYSNWSLPFFSLINIKGYEELTCHCGGEVLLPPVPCGSKPPVCSRPCARPHPCDHPGTSKLIQYCVYVN